MPKENVQGVPLSAELLFFVLARGDIVSDIIEESRDTYADLFDKSYHFIVGKKGKSIEFDVMFSKDQYYHLMGFQYIQDNLLSVKNNKDDIFDKLADLDFRNELLNNEYFIEENLAERISVIANLEELMDNCTDVYKYNPKAGSRINADFVLKGTDQNGRSYFCIVKDDTLNFFVGKSAFRRSMEEKDYANGHTSYSLLYKEKSVLNLQTREVVKTKPLYVAPIYRTQFEEKIKSKSVNDIAEMLSMSRNDFSTNPSKDNSMLYNSILVVFQDKLQQSGEYKVAEEILKKELKNADDSERKLIEQELKDIEENKINYETEKRTVTVSFPSIDKNNPNTLKFATSSGEYVPTAARQITFDIPIPPRKPLKALYIKMRDVVHSIADKFKSKPDNKSSGSGNGSSISKPQTDNNQSKDKKPEQKQDISQTIPSQPSVQTDIPNNSLSEEDKTVRTIIEQATGKKAEEMSPQLFEQLFEQVKELYQENIVNQAKPQHKSEPAPKTAEPKEEPTEHSLTAEKDSYEIDL